LGLQGLEARADGQAEMEKLQPSARVSAMEKKRFSIARDALNSRARRQFIVFAIGLGLALAVILWRLIF
jgi:hypothetical protein